MCINIKIHQYRRMISAQQNDNRISKSKQPPTKKVSGCFCSIRKLGLDYNYCCLSQ